MEHYVNVKSFRQSDGSERCVDRTTLRIATKYLWVTQTIETVCRVRSVGVRVSEWSATHPVSLWTIRGRTARVRARG